MFASYSEDGQRLLTDPDSKIRGRFVLTGTGSTVANTLRRSILMETRSVGFRADLTNTADPGIKITKNTGPIFNEMLAHRLTLLPVGVRNIDDFDPTKYEFALSVANDTAETRHVTADMFQVREKADTGLFVPLDATVTAAMFPSDPITASTSLITTLRPRWNPDLPPDEIDLVAYPVIGRGRDFMGFSPVAQCSFENTRDTDPVRQESFFQEWLSSFKKVTDSSTLDPAVLESYRAEWRTMAIQRCFLVDSAGNPNSFTFTIESVGIRPVRDIVAEGIKAVIDLVRPYTETGTVATLQVLPVESRMSGVRVVFEDQEHTLGCLLEAMIHELYLNVESPDAPVSYAAYKVPPPLQKKMIVVLGSSPEKPVTEDGARAVIVAAAGKALSVFEEMRNAWTALTALTAA